MGLGNQEVEYFTCFSGENGALNFWVDVLVILALDITISKRYWKSA